MVIAETYTEVKLATLRVLAQGGGPLSARQIYRHVTVQVECAESTVRGFLRGFKENGVVVVTQLPRDRRIHIYELTDDGRQEAAKRLGK